MKNAHTNRKVARSLHAVIVPFPAQGHIVPALQLARKLVEHGFRITFVNTIHNHKRMMKSRSKAMEPDNDIEFVAVSDGLPDDFPRLGDQITKFCIALLEMGPVFAELFANLLHKSPITCVIRDINFTAVHESANKLSIPVVGISTPSAIALQCMYHLQPFKATELLPIPHFPAHVSTSSLHTVKFTLGLPRSDEEATIQQAPLTCLPDGSLTMHIDDIPTFFRHFYREHLNPLLPSCECILYNTFYDLEGESILDAMSDINSNIYAIGPLVLNSTTVDGVEELSLACAGSGLLEEDPISLSWLDNQKPNSVVYISFGSAATMSMEQMQEFACGLETSGHAFLWVIRTDLIENMHENKEVQNMFSDFGIRTRDRALLVSWAPQSAVLSHPSSQVKDGTTIVSKEEVAKMVRKIMARDETDFEVAEIRTNVKNLQVAARKAVGKGGSSQIALRKFIELIKRNTTQQLLSSEK